MVSVSFLWRLLVCSLFAGVFVGCGDGTRERVVSELHFELEPLTSRGSEAVGLISGMTQYQSEDVREYFSRVEVHVELGKTLGRETEDIGVSLTVDAVEDSRDRFILKAEGKDCDEAGVLARAALAQFEDHLIKSEQRHREAVIAHMERQIEEQELKVAAAKAKMDAALDKLKSAQSEGEE